MPFLLHEVKVNYFFNQVGFNFEILVYFDEIVKVRKRKRFANFIIENEILDIIIDLKIYKNHIGVCKKRVVGMV